MVDALQKKSIKRQV